MAQDLPSCDLTPESRVLNHLMKDWHRTTDHEFDLQLDFLYSEDSVPKEFQSNYCSNLYRNFDWSMPTSGKVPGMEQHANATDTAARAQASEAQAAENQQAAVHDAAATSPLAHPLNDFDNPEYHVQSSHTDASGSSAQVALGSSTEAKRETTASSGTNPVNPTVPSAPNHGAQIAGGHHPMQRTATEPNIHSSFLQSHGLPASSGSYYQASGIHPGLRSQYQQPPQSTATSYGRMRGHTAGYTPVSHHTQQYQQYPIPIESNLRHPMDSVWNHGVAPYPLTQVSNGVAYQLYDTVGQNDFTFNPQASSSNGIGINRNNNHENVLTSNSLRGNVNNSRLIGSHNHHIYNSGSLPMTNPEDHYFHPTESHAPPAYMNVPAAKILKSQPAVSSGGTVSSNLSAGSRSRNAATKIQQYLDMVNEDEELDLPEVELNYSTIEAAKAAERPKLKTNAHKDETIPRTDEEKQLMVKFLYRCMHTTKKGTGEGDAKDNQGMINQWLKLRQDEARVEQAAWRVLVG
ncbi:MAG: hypothetical protein LQ338_004653 [Usnochroma carphineum]|nr:MAG: hypothetical protein LQ338_004653 [Usnochroma carphineum]